MLPVLWKIREGYPNAKITLLIAEINKHHLIRDGVFYMRFCEHHNIELLDFIDFLPNWLRPFRNLLRQLTKRAPVDGQSDNRVIDFILYHLTKFLKNQVDYTLALSAVSADLLFINDEWWDELPKLLMDLIIKHHRKIFLAQHGPTILAHEKPSDMQERVMLYAIPTLVDGIQSGKVFHQHWFETPNGVGIYRHVIAREPLLGPYQSKQVPLAYMGLEDREESIELERLTYVGFPGFDSEWFNYVDMLMLQVTAFSTIVPRTAARYSFMLLTRDISDVYKSRSSTTTLKNFIKILETLKNTFDDCNFIMILKPRPAQNLDELRSLMRSVGYTNYIIVSDAICCVLPHIDFAITLQSSGAYYPLLHGVPCIEIINAERGQRNYIFNQMELNLRRVVIDLNDLSKQCHELVDELKMSLAIANDVEHMRKFYPDGATNLIIDQIKDYLE